MRPQQITRLNELEEQLTDLFSEECKPAEWRKATKEPARKEAWMQKKVALSTMQLIGRIQNVLRDVRRTDSIVAGDATRTPDTPDEGDDDRIAREAAAFDRHAKALLKKHGRKTH